MSKEQDETPVSRRELAEALAKSNALVEEQGKALAELRAAPAANGDAVQLEILKTLQELRASTQRSIPGSAFYTGPRVETVPYRGYVKATTKCQLSHPGPDGAAQVHVHEEGAVFGIDVPALWSDDPYVPVLVTGYEDQAQTKPITKPNPDAPQSVDFRFRRQVELEEKPTLRRASEY